MSDETREKYLTAVNIICEQFGLEKPSQIIYVCEAVDRLVEEYRIENEELKGTVSRAGYRIAELKNEIDELKALHESDKKATALLMQKWEAERNELKAHCKAVDEVNEKMKCCGNCKNYPKQPTNTLCKYGDSCGKELDKWELAE